MSLAFVFPGQGSQSVGMSSALAEKYPLVKNLYSEASEVLGYDLWKLVSDGPESELNITAKTQPALLTASVAVWNIWQEHGGKLPAIMAGHSLGEYSALVCSGALAFSDAVGLVADRGAYMQTAVPEGTGTMAAILGLAEDDVIKICKEYEQDQVVSAANFNSAGQIVIAGHTEAVNRVVEAASKAGAKRSVILPVSVPSHCALMKKAAEKFAERIENVSISVPDIPIIHNVNVSQLSDPLAIKQALVDQLSHPVRWVEIIESMKTSGISGIIECGPGKVLCGLIKRIDKQITTWPVYDPDTLDTAMVALSH